MKRKKTILANINTLNILLLAAAILLFYLLDYPLIVSENKVFKPKVKGAAAFNEVKAASANGISYLDYAAVAEKNLFHPERKVPVEKIDKQLLVRPEIILYGTLITRDKRMAYIEDKKAPYSTPGRGKRQITIDEGSMISGFKLIEVHEEFILLMRGDEKIMVRLSDQKSRTHGKSQAATSAATAVNPAVNQMTPFVERKSGAASTQLRPAAQIQPAMQPPPVHVRPKTTIPQRRESTPLRRPNVLEYNK